MAALAQAVAAQAVPALGQVGLLLLLSLTLPLSLPPAALPPAPPQAWPPLPLSLPLQLAMVDGAGAATAACGLSQKALQV